LWKRKKEGIKVEEIKTEVEEFRFTGELIDLLDWERIWQEVYDFKKADKRGSPLVLCDYCIFKP